MPPDQNSSFGASQCMEDEGYQTLSLPLISTPNDHNMPSYSSFSSHDNGCFPLYYDDPPNISFPCRTDYNILASAGAAIPTTQQQFAFHPQYVWPEGLSGLPCMPRSRFSMQIDPFGSTMEPQMMLKQEEYRSPMLQSLEERSIFSTTDSACLPDLISATTASPSLSLASSHEQYCPRSTWSQDMSLCGVSGPEQCETILSDSMEHGDEEVYDKPYAQLIYEALLEAPDHRMLLRDIYEWFIQNTRKPRDSGTNGWQNSIRHNLSMNQAFENDKNDPAASRGARKANSVWVLTEQAIKYGVQSTTRYRKNGTTKKNASNRIPAIQRQRSGAKGGRAARRAGRLRRQEGGLRQRIGHSRSSTPIPSIVTTSPGLIAHDEWSSCSYSPTTPAGNQFLTTSYRLPGPYCSFFEHDQDFEPKYDDEESCPDQNEHLQRLLSDPTLNDTLEETPRVQIGEWQ